MIELYASGSSNVHKILLMLEEIEAPYEVRFVDVFKGQQFEPEFVALNPNSKVPVIVDRRGPKPITIFESGAILIHLAEQAGVLLPTSPAERADVLQWLMIQVTGLGPMFGQYVHFTRYKKDDPYAEARYRTEAIRLLDLVDARLAASPWMGGAEYSIADIAMFPWLRILRYLGLPHEGRPNLERWLAEVYARPATARFLQKLKPLMQASDETVRQATGEDLDRFLGRGQYSRSN